VKDRYGAGAIDGSNEANVCNEDVAADGRRGWDVYSWPVRDLAAEGKMRSISNPDGDSRNSYGFAGERR
jgi:hypothetical protein